MSIEPETAAPTPTPATSPTPHDIRRLQPKRILVPVDFSERSLKALEYALAFAAQFHSTLLLVHVIELKFLGIDYAAAGVGQVDTLLVESELLQTAAKRLERLVAEVVSGRVPVTTEVRQGQAWYEITRAGETSGADLIILGTHGYTGLKHVVMGSTAERVARYATCPVLIVREREQECLEPGPSGTPGPGTGGSKS